MAEVEELQERLAALERERWALVAQNEDVLVELRELQSTDRPGFHASRINELSRTYNANRETVRGLDEAVSYVRGELRSARLDAHADDLVDLRAEEDAAYNAVVDAVGVLAHVQQRIADLGALPHRRVNLGIQRF